MSNSIRLPWIYDYLREVAEERGGDLISAQSYKKGRKAQLVQWLTYPRDAMEDTFIWAIISDKVHTVPVRFSKEAVRSLRENPMFLGRSLTEYRTSIVIIKQFRPFCSRVPIGGDKGISKNSHIALDVNEFALAGSYNEPVWGAPKSVEDLPDICEWVEGLRQGGGGGNVLKLRKLQQNESANAPPDLEGGGPGRAMPGDYNQKPLQRKAKLFPKRAIQRNSPVEQPSVPPEPFIRPGPDIDPRKAYERKWKLLVKSRNRIMPPSDDVKEILRSLPFNGDKPLICSVLPSGPGHDTAPSPAPSTPPRKPQRRHALDLGTSPPEGRSQSPDEPLPGTPSIWSPSNRGSPLLIAPSLRVAEEPANDDTSPARDIHVSSPVLQLNPEVALPDRLAAHTEQKAAELTTASVGSPKTVSSTTAPEPVSSYLSAPTPAQRLRPPTSSSPPTYTDQRRVRRLVVGRFSPDTEASGPGRVLVPNSDTSASMSQDQPFSQSLPNSSIPPVHSQPESQHSESQEQEQRRSQQSLSYASGSGSQGNSQSKSQALRQSQLRNEATAEISEVAEPSVVAEPNTEASRPAARVAEVPIPGHQDVSEPGADDVWEETPPQLETASPQSVEESEEEVESDNPAEPPSRALSPAQEVEVLQNNEGSETEEDSDDEENALGPVGDAASRQSSPLDSDDEKTRAMIDGYSVRNTDFREVSSKAIPSCTPSKKSRSHDPAKPGREITSNPLSAARSYSSDLPVPPSSPDVFMSDASFHSHTSRSRKASQAGNSLSVKSTQPEPEPPTSPPLTRRASYSQKPRRVDSGSSDRTHVDRGNSLLDERPLHDPVAWQAPAFKRKRIDAKEDVPPTTGRLVAGTKPLERAISISCEEEEQPPMKKVKTTNGVVLTTGSREADVAAAAIATARPVGRSTAFPSSFREPQFGQSVSTDRWHDTSSSNKQRELRRGASIISSVQASTGRRQRSGSSRAETPDKCDSVEPEIRTVRQLSPSGTTREIKHVDFRSSSRQSSLASSVSKGNTKARMSEESATGMAPQPLSIARERDGSRLKFCATRHSQGESSRSSLKGAAALPLPPLMPKEPGRPMAQSPTVQFMQRLPASSSRAPQPSQSSRRVTEPTADPSRLLGGYQVNLEMLRTEDGPPLVTWSELKDILLGTGRARHKQMQNMKNSGSGPG